MSECGYQYDDEVYVKIIQIRDDGKLSLSIKDVDQRTGKDLYQRRPKQPDGTQQTFTLDSQGRRVGLITGILIDDTNIKVNRRGGVARVENANAPDMWEMKQLKGG